MDGEELTREIISSTAYNAQGQVSCQTAPYDVAFYSDRAGNNWPYDVFIADSCDSANIPHTTTTYDALGRSTMVAVPDGNRASTIYGLNSVYTHNTANQMYASFYDVHGQLVAVDEQLSAYHDDFSDSSGLNSWSTWGDGTKIISQRLFEK